MKMEPKSANVKSSKCLRLDFNNFAGLTKLKNSRVEYQLTETAIHKIWVSGYQTDLNSKCGTFQSVNLGKWIVPEITMNLSEFLRKKNKTDMTRCDVTAQSC